MTYAELANRSAALAAALRGRLALQPGDRVALTMTNCPQYLEVLFAIWHAGLTAVPVNAKLHANEFAYILENSGARVAFATPNLAPTIGGIETDTLATVIETGSADYEALFAAEPMPLAQIEATDVAWLFYTSGTTGQPKGRC